MAVATAAAIEPRNKLIEFDAGITNAKPAAGALGARRLSAAGPIARMIASSTPSAAARPMAGRAPSGTADKPPDKTSATAFQVTTAGAGHSAVISMAFGSGISAR